MPPVSAQDNLDVSGSAVWSFFIPSICRPSCVASVWLSILELANSHAGPLELTGSHTATHNAFSSKTSSTVRDLLVVVGTVRPLFRSRESSALVPSLF